MVRAREVLRAHAAILVLALVAAAIALVSKLVLFPDYSGNLDEPVYVLQAKTLASGHLTLSAAEHDAFFRPWLVGEHDGHLFTKYLPGFPAVLAVPLALFGTATPALPVIAAGWVLAVYAFALELFGSRRLGLVAAALTAVSPIFLVQSALFLTYGLSVAVLLGAVTLTLRAARTGRLLPAGAAGFLFGFDVLVRQFDVLLVVVLLAVYLLLDRRYRPARPIRLLGAAALAALPWLLIVLAYDAVVTGSPFRLPLSATDPLDRFGFGTRRILPGQPTVGYGPVEAWKALRHNVATVPSWSAGGILLVLLAVVGLVAAGRRREKFLVLGLVLVFPLGYFTFWGTALSAISALNGIGPHYYIPSFAGLAVLAAAGVERLLALPRVAAVAVPVLLLVAAVPLTLSALGPKIDVQDFVKNRRASAIAPLRADPPVPPAVVLVDIPEGDRTSVGNPYGFLANPPDLDAPVLYAATRGTGDWRLPEVAGGRKLYALRPKQLDRAEEPFGRSSALVPLQPVAATRLRVDVAMTPRPGTRCLAAYLVVGGQGSRVPLGCDVRPGVTYRHTFEIGGGGGVPLPPAGTSTLLTVGVASSAPGVPEQRDEVRNSLGVVAAAGGPQARLLTPGPSWRLVAFPTGTVWLPARVTPELSVRVVPTG